MKNTHQHIHQNTHKHTNTQTHTMGKSNNKQKRNKKKKQNRKQKQTQQLQYQLKKKQKQKQNQEFRCTILVRPWLHKYDCTAVSVSTNCEQKSILAEYYITTTTYCKKRFFTDVKLVRKEQPVKDTDNSWSLPSYELELYKNGVKKTVPVRADYIQPEGGYCDLIRIKLPSTKEDNKHIRQILYCLANLCGLFMTKSCQCHPEKFVFVLKNGKLIYQDWANLTLPLRKMFADSGATNVEIVNEKNLFTQIASSLENVQHYYRGDKRSWRVQPVKRIIQVLRELAKCDSIENQREICDRAAKETIRLEFA